GIPSLSRVHPMRQVDSGLPHAGLMPGHVRERGTEGYPTVPASRDAGNDLPLTLPTAPLYSAARAIAFAGLAFAALADVSRGSAGCREGSWGHRYECDVGAAPAALAASLP